MAHKLDIFETLTAIDRHDLDFYDRLPEDLQKGFAPPVVLRWASAINDGPNAAVNVWLVNDRANMNFWEIAGHPELQYKLLASCGLGKTQRHQWINMVGRAKKSDRVRDFLIKFWPDANDMELDIIFNQFTEETFEEFVLSSGEPPADIKEILEAYARLTGKAKPKSKRAKSKD
jgi:hypothetical protein